MSVCPTCSHQNPDGAFICAHCGSSIESLPQLDRSQLDIRPQQRAATEQEGFGLGILIGIAYVTLVVVILFGIPGLFGSIWLLLFLGFPGLALFFLAEPRTRSMGWGMLTVLVVLLVIVVALFLLLLRVGCCPVYPA